MVSATPSCGHFASAVSAGFGSAGKVNIPRQELFDSVDGMVGNASEDVRQIGFRIDTVQFRGTNQSVHGGGAFASGVRTRKQIVLPAQRDSSQCPLCRIVVNLQSAIVTISK